MNRICGRCSRDYIEFIFLREKVFNYIYRSTVATRQRGAKAVRPNSSGKPLDYPTMTLAEIEELHKQFLSSDTEEKHNVFMWCIDKYLCDADEFMKCLGYKRHARIIWDKLNGPSPAFTVRFRTEYLVWYYKPGKIVMPRKECRGKYSTIIREASTVHSKKPIAAYEMLEDMFADENKIELFARNTRDGWDCFGNEVQEV